MKSRKAFTLIELLIVIAIIGILSTVLFISLNSARKKAQDAKVKSDIASLSTALEIIKVDRNPALSSLRGLVDNTTTNDDTNINRWRDGGNSVLTVANPSESEYGTRLVPKLPANPINGGFYKIAGSAAKGYVLFANLNGTQKFWCNQNGNGMLIENKSEGDAAALCISIL